MTYRQRWLVACTHCGSVPRCRFPLCPRPGGVLERGGHTESAYDLCRLAGKPTVSVIGELMREDGEMMRFEESVELGKKSRRALALIVELPSFELGGTEYTKQLNFGC